MILDEQLMVDVDKAVNFLNTGRAVEAVQEFTNILTKNDKIALAWNNRGLALLQLGHPFDAILNIEKALQLEPDSAEYFLNLGACYMEFEQTDKAIKYYRKSLEIKRIAQTFMNLANSLKYQGKLKASLQFYRECVNTDPSYVDGHLVRAFAELCSGNFKDGFEEFEWRWKSSQLVPRGLHIEAWRGENLKGKTVLIYGEQGHGDSLHFMRYASLIKEKFDAKKVIVEARQPLVRLFKTLPNIDEVIMFGDEVPSKDIDYMAPVMSMPRLFGTTLETVPWNGPYFKANPTRVALWREKLKQMPPGLLIGVCWAGLSRPGRPQADSVDKRRSTTLQEFAPLAKIKDISWVSLQKGLPRDQIMTPPTGMTIGDWSDEFDDFYDTAALIECLDLVITVDTAIVHLAAALGKPTWLLSRWDGCWRWLGTRQDSPWYPTLRQFTQPAPHAWAPMMQDAAVALRDFVKASAQKAA